MSRRSRCSQSSHNLLLSKLNFQHFHRQNRETHPRAIDHTRDMVFQSSSASIAFIKKKLQISTMKQIMEWKILFKKTKKKKI